MTNWPVRSLTVELPRLPPSSNNAYMNTYGRGRALTPEARTWKAAAILLIRHAAVAAGFTPAPRTSLRLEIHLSLPAVRRSDASGRIKLLEDAVAAAIGIDDRYVDELVVTKRRGPEAVQVVVTALG